MITGTPPRPNTAGFEGANNTMIRTIATQPDSTNPLAPWNRPDPVFLPVLCGSQPDGDEECQNEVKKGSLCEACKEYNQNNA